MALPTGHAAAQLGRGRLRPAREAQQRIIDDLFGKFDAYGFTVTLIRMLGDHGNIAVEYEASGRTAPGSSLPELLRNGSVDRERFGQRDSSL